MLILIRSRGSSLHKIKSCESVGKWVNCLINPSTHYPRHTHHKATQNLAEIKLVFGGFGILFIQTRIFKRSQERGNFIKILSTSKTTVAKRTWFQSVVELKQHNPFSTSKFHTLRFVKVERGKCSKSNSTKFNLKL